MRATALAILCALVLVAAPEAASAQQRTPVRAIATLSANTVSLGERLRLTVTVLHPDDVLVSVDPPARTATLQLVEVAPRPNTPLANTGAEVTSRFEYVVALFALGDMPLPPLLVSWIDADGITGEVQAAAPVLAVVATSAPEDTTLRPLKPQLEVAGAPPAWQRPAAVAAVALLLVVAGTAAIRQLRRRRVPALREAVLADTLAESAARGQLDVLAADDPLSRGDYDTYYGTIAAVVRDYLQQRFEFNARSLTTTELQQHMVALGVERWQARLVSGLLDRCDAAVYAGRRPDPISADHDLTVAFEIVELARPSQLPIPAGREPVPTSIASRRSR